MIAAVGGSQTFRIFGYGAFVCLVVHVLVQKLRERYACGSGKDIDGDIASVKVKEMVVEESVGGRNRDEGLLNATPHSGNN